MPRKPRTQAGFNLIEMAIVLALVGLVIGGIWAGATAARENIRVNNTSDMVYQVAENLRALYVARPQGIRGNDDTFNARLNKSGVYPQEMRRDEDVEDGPTDHFWSQGTGGSTVTIDAFNMATNASVSAADTPAKWFRINYLNLPSNICASLITHGFDSDVRLGLEAITVTTGSTAIFCRGGNTQPMCSGDDKLPPALPAATAACGNGTATVRFIFELH